MFWVCAFRLGWVGLLLERWTLKQGLEEVAKQDNKV